MLGVWRERWRIRRKLRALKRVGIDSRRAASIGAIPIRTSRKRTVEFSRATAADLHGGARYEAQLAKKRRRRGESSEVHDDAAAFLRRLAGEVSEAVADLKPTALAAAFKEADAYRDRRLADARSTFKRRATKGIVGP